MTLATATSAPRAGHGLRLVPGELAYALIWLIFASAFVVIVEPAPVDLIFFLALGFFIYAGLSYAVPITPLMAFLLLYNLGGFFSMLQVMDDPRAVFFVITTSYMGVSAVFFACLVAENPLRNMEVIRRGLMFSAVVASIIAIAGYADVAGLREKLSPISRAQGLFKDPNVFSTFIILPMVLSVQSFLLGTHRRRWLAAINLLILLAALFLAFSRGAWMNFIMASVILVGATFVVTPHPGMRSRIILWSIGGFLLVVLMLAILLSIPQVRALFAERANVTNYYDAGETGRFGNQLRSLPLLLVSPNGFGPVQFRYYFGQDPHNVFLNAFASFGWLGGITYFILIISTLWIGLKTVLTRTPWQHYAIAVYAVLTATIFQGVQIDTEHWRHFYWALGIMWGLYAATLQPDMVPDEPDLQAA